MTQFNSETIVSTVLKVLQKKFTTAKRYRDFQNQNIVRPCFFVELLTVADEKQMNNRARRNPRIKITYLGKQAEEQLSKHLRSVGDSLLESLQFLRFGETGVFGREAEYEIVADELIFTINYPVHLVLDEATQPTQSNLDLNTDIK